MSPAQPSPAGDAAVLNVIPKSSPQDERTSELVDRLRDDVLPGATRGSQVDVYVGGATATLQDLADKIAGRLPIFIAMVVGLSVLLLMAVFRSLWVPLVSAAFNLLSIAAAYGVVVLVFQEGVGSSLLGVDGEVPIVSFVPLFMFAILFGLSMDYNVFLQSRIREEYLRGAGPEQSVVRAMARVGRIILAAGVIMTSVFLGFVSDPDVVVKTIGLGLAAAILIDVLVVRMVVAPAVMTLLGDRAWTLPAWLDRVLPRISLEGELHDERTPPGAGGPRAHGQGSGPPRRGGRRMTRSPSHRTEPRLLLWTGVSQQPRHGGGVSRTDATGRVVESRTSGAGQRRRAGGARRSAAAHARQSTLSGIARSRACAIGSPHASHVPWVPSSSFASARSVRARRCSSEPPTPMSVNRLTASTVPSPIRLPNPTALPRSGRAASTAIRSRVTSRRASSSRRTASRSGSSAGVGIRPFYPIEPPPPCRTRGAEKSDGTGSTDVLGAPPAPIDSAAGYADQHSRDGRQANAPGSLTPRLGSRRWRPLASSGHDSEMVSAITSPVERHSNRCMPHRSDATRERTADHSRLLRCMVAVAQGFPPRPVRRASMRPVRRSRGARVPLSGGCRGGVVAPELEDVVGGRQQPSF